MKDGFIKVCCVTPDIRVADCEYNADNIIRNIKEANERGVKLSVFPELCVSGYTCGDLFSQDILLRSAENAVLRIADETDKIDMVCVIGAPVMFEQKLYNCAIVMHRGCIIGVVPKHNIPNYSEFYEARHFAPGKSQTCMMDYCGEKVPFGMKILFKSNIRNFIFACEICEDLWVANPPSSSHAMAGATVILNLSASDENVAKSDYRRDLVCSQSGRLCCAYLYADAGEGESTTDLVFAGENMIVENGAVLTKSELFKNGMIITEIDVDKLAAERKRISTFDVSSEGYTVIPFELSKEDCAFTRFVSQTPFVPHGEGQVRERSEEILAIQAMGLKKRLAHTGAKTAVVGVSGGLDSTLALLVTARAFDSLGLDRNGIIAVTMPCFGTTDRTYNNAVAFASSLNVTLNEVPIEAAVRQHFKDIGHDGKTLDVTYENSQARERTQVLMDIANRFGGLVIGTGDMSELALGWATYNGDHMSMYAVNASVPKTLIRYLVHYEAEKTDNNVLRKVLEDILATPVSPELLPPEEGEISQKTESIVGPYELHDFFLYYMMRFGFAPKKIFRLARYAFGDKYKDDFILSWMRTFYKRFFSQQFKRSCVPDGPKVGTVALSPRGDWRMPSDASASIWLNELERLI